MSLETPRSIFFNDPKADSLYERPMIQIIAAELNPADEM